MYISHREQEPGRIVLTDGTGRWFNAAKSICFTDGHKHVDDGSGGATQVSATTNSPWIREKLYLTDTNKWVLNRCEYIGSGSDTYVEISREEAMLWLGKTDYAVDVPDNLPLELEI